MADVGFVIPEGTAKWRWRQIWSSIGEDLLHDPDAYQEDCREAGCRGCRTTQERN